MKAEIELSERLRKACVERGITNPKFVAQDWSGNWYHYVAEPYMCKESWRGTFTSDDEDEILLETETELNNSWRDTLMEFVTPKIEAGKRYWRRDGSVSGVISHNQVGQSHVDLIAEYREEEKPIVLKEAQKGYRAISKNMECVFCGKSQFITIELT